METLKDRIEELLRNDLSTLDMVEVHNAYCDRNKYYDDWIERVSDIDFRFSDTPPTEIIDRLGKINTSDYYYVEGIYDTTSFDYYDESPITYYEDIAQYCADYEDDLGNREIRDCIDEWNEEHEEDECENEE